MLRWCESHHVEYIVGIGDNARLKRLGADLIEQAETNFCVTGEKPRLFGEFDYAAATWDRERRVIIKAEHTALGKNTRLAYATRATIRNKLIRIGAVVLRNTRRIQLHLSTACPHQKLFALAAARLE
jgi:hypothetical protein